MQLRDIDTDICSYKAAGMKQEVIQSLLTPKTKTLKTFIGIQHNKVMGFLGVEALLNTLTRLKLL